MHDTIRAALLLLALGALACQPTTSREVTHTAPPADSLGDDDDATNDATDDAAGDDDDSASLGDDDDSATPGDDDDSTDPPGDDDDSVGDGVCPDDVFEDNDDQNAAVQLTAGLQAGLTSCVEDEDWFAIEVPAGDELTVALTFADDEGDIDVTITDPAGAWLGGSSSTTDDELAGPIASTGGWMFVKVRLFGDAGVVAGNDYDLELSVGAAPPPEVCPTDAFEENDDAASAIALPVGSHAALTVCGSDADWYSLEVAAGQTLTASALFPHAEGDVDITLYDASETWLASSVSVTDDEDLSWTATDATSVLLKVVLYNDNGTVVGNDYDLAVALQ